jgi:hypothetical protein
MGLEPTASMIGSVPTEKRDLQECWRSGQRWLTSIFEAICIIMFIFLYGG